MVVSQEASIRQQGEGLVRLSHAQKRGLGGQVPQSNHTWREWEAVRRIPRQDRGGDEPPDRPSGSPVLTVVEAHRHDVVRVDRQPVQGQNLPAAAVVRIFEGAQLERQHGFSLQTTTASSHLLRPADKRIEKESTLYIGSGGLPAEKENGRC